MQVPTSASKFEGLKKAIEKNDLAMMRQWVKLGAPLPDDALLMRHALAVGSAAALTELCVLGAVKPHNAQEVLLEAVSAGNITFAKQMVDQHAKSMLLLSVVKKMVEATDTAKQGTLHMQLLEYLLAKHHVVGTQSVLEEAVRRGCLEAVTLLVKAGQTLSDWIMHDVKHPGMVGPLIRMGGDLECAVIDKGTPILTYAELSNHAGAILGEAIDCGADVSVRTAEGHSVLNRFLRRHYKDIVSGRTSKFMGPETDRSLVARLLDMGIDDGTGTVIGSGSRLKLAIVFGAKEAIRQQVEKHGFTTVNSGDYSSTVSLLQLAAIANSAAAVQELHALGADVNAMDGGTKESPLAIAVDSNSPAAVAALLECGADPSVKINISGRRPLSLLAYAAEQKYGLVAKMLRSANSGHEIGQALDAGLAGSGEQPPIRSKSLEAL